MVDVGELSHYRALNHSAISRRVAFLLINWVCGDVREVEACGPSLRDPGAKAPVLPNLVPSFACDTRRPLDQSGRCPANYRGVPGGGAVILKQDEDHRHGNRDGPRTCPRNPGHSREPAAGRHPIFSIFPPRRPQDRDASAPNVTPPPWRKRGRPTEAGRQGSGGATLSGGATARRSLPLAALPRLSWSPTRAFQTLPRLSAGASPWKFCATGRLSAAGRFAGGHGRRDRAHGSLG